jgi:hypothetical protein
MEEIMNAQAEQDFRVKILDSFLSSTHRGVEKILPFHKELLEQDPLFYGHLAVWAQENTSIRDQHEVFLAHLFVSALEEHREAAFCLLDKFPPYQIDRIINHLKEKMAYRKKGAKKKGFNPPRILRTAVKQYLAKREEAHEWFDTLAIRQRKAMLSLYSRFRIKPGERAQKILFDQDPPEDSRVYMVKELTKEKDPTEQAKIIVKNRIPYPVASSVIKKMTPSVLVALIDVMSPQELLSNMGSLKKHGAFNNDQVKDLVKKKLGKAQKAKRVDVMKGKKAAEVAGVSEDLKHELQEVTEKQLKAIAIKRPTALFIDKSGSMDRAIELGKQVGAVISGGISANFYCYAFDVMAYPIEVNSDKLADWEKALQHIRAGGATAIGVPLEWMIRQKQRVEQIVIITDEQENNSPTFHDSYAKYVKQIGMKPDVVILYVENRWSSSGTLTKRCQMNDIPFDRIAVPADLDYYSVPNILSILSRKSRVDLLMEIMMTPLPKREVALAS